MSEPSTSERTSRAFAELKEERELMHRVLRAQLLMRLALLTILAVTMVAVTVIVAGAGEGLAGRKTDITVGVSTSFAVASVLSMVLALLSGLKSRSQRAEIRRLRQRIRLLERELGMDDPTASTAGAEVAPPIEEMPADAGGYPPSGQPPVINVFPPDGGNSGLGRSQLLAVIVAVVAGIFSIGTAWVGRDADHSDCVAYSKQLAALDAQYPVTLTAALDMLHFEGYEERCGDAKAIVQKLRGDRPQSTTTTADPRTTATSSP